MTIAALESYLDLLIARARYGRKLSALGYCAYVDAEKIKAIKSDQSLPDVVRKRLVREYRASIGEALLLDAKHDATRRKAQRKSGRLKARQKAAQVANAADALYKRWPRQANQEKVFRTYRAVLKREGREPTFDEWTEEDLKRIKGKIDFEEYKERKRKRDLVIREMARRFKLPVTPAR